MVNLSKYQLNDTKIDILLRGLSFCSNQDIDKFEAIKDIQLFARKIILKQLYCKTVKEGRSLKPQELQAIDNLIALLEESDLNPDLIDRIDIEHLLQKLDHVPSPTTNMTLQNVKKKSDKFPALGLNANVLAFFRLTISEIKNIKIKPYMNSNLSVPEYETLQNIFSNSTITIKPSEKGSNIVILDNE